VTGHQSERGEGDAEATSGRRDRRTQPVGERAVDGGQQRTRDAADGEAGLMSRNDQPNSSWIGRG
jgi:hypothetical protein